MRTAPQVWQRAIDRWPDGYAFLHQIDGDWKPVTYTEASELVGAAAAGFRSLGVKKGDRVAILARPTLEWTISDWALLSLGAVVVPIYPTSSTDDVTHVLAHSRAKAIVCEQVSDLERINALRERLPDIEHRVLIEPAAAAP
ncbi:MAG: AMP-binding protein, partial [Gaiellaceae bacterium]